MPQRPKQYKPASASSGAPRYTPPGMVRKTASQRGYGSKWQAARLCYLGDNPLCVPCAERGLTVEATVVDHVIPHKGDDALFWDSSNWMAMCDSCHNRKSATYDGGFGRAVKPQSDDASDAATV